MALLTDSFWGQAAFPPPGDRDQADLGVSSFLDACQNVGDDDPLLHEFAEALIASDDGRDLLNAVFGNSPFLTQCILRDPIWFRQLINIGAEQSCRELIETTRQLKLSDLDEAAVMRELRILKRRVSLSIALADIARIWEWPSVTNYLSEFANAAIGVACTHALRRGAARGAFRLKSETDPEVDSGFFVIAMGKLGAHELNYSSDIDLICLFDPERIDTDDDDGLLQNVVRVTRTLARVLDERTADGYVFRVDLRLRPDPASTPLAISVLAAETYYESLGQNWERAAMIKARVAAGDMDCGQTFIGNLRPFVWRKSLDFAAIEDIHSIKRQIHAHKGGGEIAVEGHDIKTGRGGIREIEFFAQTQQLIWGGRELDLRTNRTIDAINILVEIGQVSPETARDMEAGYRFLRRVEHRLQMRNDEQTQKLPGTAEEITALATFLGYAAADDFRSDLLGHLETVQNHYGELFGASPSLSSDDDFQGSLSFTGSDSDQDTLQTLSQIGFSDPSRVDSAIRAWHHGRVRATRTTRARELLTALTPTILREIASQSDPDATFGRFDTFLSELPAGVQLFTMFQAYPQILGLIAEIMGEAPRLASHLGRRPNLLDSVLSVDFYEPIGSMDELVSECREALSDAQYLEDALDAARLWNEDKRFQLGIQMIRKVVRPVDAAEHLSDVAEAAIGILVPRVIEEFETKHGRVGGGRFCILALGKLGSREMTPSSDLDLVFIYDCNDLTSESDGSKPLAVSQYYGRLGQRIISAIMSRTAEGTLYEVDMRLRPSGNKGPISTSLEGFRKYYEETAWTWEFMTLVRSRPVFATHKLDEEISRTVEGILCRPRDVKALVTDVTEMRARIEKQYTTRSPWSIKHAPGGLVDIDFIAQFLVLVHSSNHPELLHRSSRNIFAAGQRAGLIETDTAETLIEAANLFQQILTFLSLVIDGNLDDDRVSLLSQRLKSDIAEIVEIQDFDNLYHRLVDTETNVRHIFETIVGPVGVATDDTDAIPPIMD